MILAGSAVLVLCAVLPCTRAQASSGARAALFWHAPAAQGCMTPAALEDGVESLLARDAIIAEGRSDLSIHAFLQREAGHWLARVELRRSGALLGTRELVGDSHCGSLARSLVIVVATLLDAVPAPPQSEGPSVGVSARLALGALRTPLWSGALMGSVALSEHLLAVTELGVSLPRHVATSQEGRGANFQVFDASLALCPQLLKLSALRVLGCAGAQLGLIQARGTGFDAEAGVRRLHASALLELALRVHLTRQLALQVAAGAQLVLSRPQFYFEDSAGIRRPIERSELFAGQLRLGFIVNSL